MEKIVDQVKYYWNKCYGNGKKNEYRDVLFKKTKETYTKAINAYEDWKIKYIESSSKSDELNKKFYGKKDPEFEVVFGSGTQGNPGDDVLGKAVNDIESLLKAIENASGSGSNTNNTNTTSSKDLTKMELNNAAFATRKIAVFESFLDACKEDFKFRLWPWLDNKKLKECYKDIIKKGEQDTWIGMGYEIFNYLYEQLDTNPSLDNWIKIYTTLDKVLYRNRFDEIDKYSQIVFTGAPGTGKTYGIREYVELACLCRPIDAGYTSKRTKEKIKQWKFVQFHSSYDYSDFVEGLRPICLGNENEPTFVRMDGVFKAFCRDVAEYNKSKFDTWKEEEENKGKLKLIEGETVDSANYWNHLNEWEEWGKMQKFYFVIDEINRADLGKVFGELMFALEEGYRDKPFDTQYMNLPTYAKKDKVVDKLTADDIFASGFFIPGNIIIVGSMNDIDRSVETFDFALRRRFQWKEINANEIMQDTLRDMFSCNPALVGEINKILTNKIIAMNKAMTDSEFHLGKEFHIGPAYFGNYTGDIKSFIKIWDEKIEPTLKEYVRGRNGDKEEFLNDCRIKLGLVLSDELMEKVDEFNEWLNNNGEMKTSIPNWIEKNSDGFQYQWFSLSNNMITELNDYIKKGKRDDNIKNTINKASLKSSDHVIEERIKEKIEEIFKPKDEDSQED